MEKIKFTDEAYNNLRSMLIDEIIVNAVKDRDTKPKDKGIFEPLKNLYHYTDLNGLIGIIESQCLWATNINFLNDKKELIYAVDLVKDVAKSISNEQNKEIVDLVIEHIEQRANRKTFVTCFSKNGDLLGQWRAYANNGNGVSIGFDSMSWASDLCPRPHSNHIQYNENYQKEYIKTMLESFISFMEGYKDEIEWTLTHSYEEVSALLIIDMINSFTQHFKHPSFKDEDEYRFLLEENLAIGNKKRGYEVLFRTNNKMIIPYIKFENMYHKFYKDLSEDSPMPTMFDEQKRLPIKEIIIGPNLDFEVVKEGISFLLDKNGYKNVEIKRSEIPYRI